VRSQGAPRARLAIATDGRDELVESARVLPETIEAARSDPPSKSPEDAMKPFYPEYRLAPELPDVIEVCARCRKGLIFNLNTDAGLRPWCYVCGNDEPGVRFRKEQPSDQRL
jgi:hypothetical protein